MGDFTISKSDDPIFVFTDGPIAYLTLNRADKMNALNKAMWARIPELLGDIEKDENLKVVILHGGRAKAFTAGADIAELNSFKGNDQAAKDFAKAVNDAQYTLGRFAKPTIAMISGPCVGGGCGLALSCDFRIADATARFGITPARLGLSYSLEDTKRLVDAVGPSKAKRILFTGELISAERALEWGMIDQLTTADGLSSQTVELAQSICAASQYTARTTKKVVQMILDGQSSDTNETQGFFLDAFCGVDFDEGTRAFVEKRRPKFRYS